MDQAGNLRTLLNMRNRNAQEPSSHARVITVTSGKGGVGKTNFTINLALYLQKQGARVIVLDADLGLANIEILLGVLPQYSLLDVITGRRTLEETITRLPSGVGFISGGSGLVDMANISDEMLRSTVEKIANLDDIADIVLIDTGAGISNAVLKFVMSAAECIVVCSPEPTSVTDAYSLVKAVKERMNVPPEFKIVLNKVDDKEEGEGIFKNLNQVSERFLKVRLNHLGSILYDRNLVKAVKQQKPCLISFPESHFAKEIEKIGNIILDLNIEKAPTGMKGFMKRLAGIFGG